MSQTIETFRFSPEMLAPARRLPGISAFMRIRNGADFLEATIRSHANMYDEIVAVYNQCTDETADILARLSKELGPQLRIFHYLPRVHPAGSKGHAQTPGDSPESLVTYSNFALCQTRHQWVVKLDDDHLAIPQAVNKMVGAIRSGSVDEQKMHCFSGLNLVRTAKGAWHIPAAAPISGKGDIGYFRATEGTHFVHDPRFERFARSGIERCFAGWFYWHLKYLKTGGGFANYELDANPKSRYTRRRKKLKLGDLWDISQTSRALAPGPLRRLRAAFDPKERLAIARDTSISTAFPYAGLTGALDATAPGWQKWLGSAQ
jgi:cellulose synthase/poly-beta-1,6-N-acetylglucosamine synthase-like glycosyltransferase